MSVICLSSVHILVSYQFSIFEKLPLLMEKQKKHQQLWLRVPKKFRTHGGTRTPNLRFRRPTPYPLGHAGTPAQNSCNTPRQLTSPADGGKNNIFVRRPGIEPGSQEWESCMIPLHQRRCVWTTYFGQKPDTLEVWFGFHQLCPTLLDLISALFL